MYSVIGRDLEQDFRDRLMALRSQSEQESEALLQQLERERGTLQEELQLLRAQEAELQEELCSATQVSSRLSPAHRLHIPLCAAHGFSAVSAVYLLYSLQEILYGLCLHAVIFLFFYYGTERSN